MKLESVALTTLPLKMVSTIFFPCQLSSWLLATSISFLSTDFFLTDPDCLEHSRIPKLKIVL